ncbi:MAG: carboxypeptidase regulatory-like domain-containing protein [Patescibacteria group bacterium]
MRKNQNRLTTLLAQYPLTFYFGLLLVTLASVILWLHISFNWNFNFDQLLTWLNRRSVLILTVVTFLLGLTLIANAVAYRLTCKLTEADYFLWLHQRATRTFFPMFTPFHDWLRMRVAIYRWWHARPYASSVHAVALIIALALSLNSVKVALADSPGTCNQDLAVTTPVSWSGITCYNNVTVNADGVLTIAGGSTVTLTSLTVGMADADSPGTVTIQGDTINDLGVTMTVSGNVLVANGSTISANGGGNIGGINTSRNGKGTGGGTAQVGGFLTTSAGGGGYGGAGGTVGIYSGGSTYGSSTSPTGLGSGGGFVLTLGVVNNGGAGGGALKITAGGTLTVSGTISANGSNSNGGGGSGGGIWLIAQTCSGSGSITANGGNGGTNGGGGGGGRAYFQCTALGSGTRTVTVTNGTGGTGAGSGTNTSAEVTASLSLTGLADGTAGSTQTLTVTAVNTAGDTATSYRGTAHFISNDTQATLPSDYTFTSGDAGVKTFSVTLKTAGSKTVTVADAVTAGIFGSTSLTVSPGSISKFGVSIISASSSTAGDATSASVTAQDVYGNIVTSYTGTISFSSTDSQATLPSNYTFIASDSGSKLVTGTIFKTVGSQTLTASQVSSGPVTSSLTGTSNQVTVQSAGAVTLVLTSTASTVLAGERLSATATLKDIYGNVATTYTGTVIFTSSDATAELPTTTVFGLSDNGVKTWSSTIFKKTGSQTLTLTDTSNPSLTATVTETVSPGAIASYQITTTSQQHYINQGWSETVTARDAYGNVVDTDSTTVLTPTSNGSAKFFSDTKYIRQVSSYQLTAGQAIIYIKDSATENLVVTVTDSQMISGSTNSITLTATSGSGSGKNGLGQSPDQGPIGETGAGEVSEIPTEIGPAAPADSTGVTVSRGINYLISNPTEISQAVSQTVQSVKTYLDTQPVIVAGSTTLSAIAPGVALIGFSPVAVFLTTTVSSSLIVGQSALQLFFTGLIPFQVRRRRRWGTVRHALTGLPLAGVFVYLLDETGKEINRKLTDNTGHYGFLVEQPGMYQLRVTNPLYGQYLSTLIPISQPEKELVIEDIGLLPIGGRVTARLARALRLITVIKFFSMLYWPLLIIGTVVLGLLLIQAITPFRLIVSAVYLVIWTAKVLEFRYYKPFGVVTDAKTNQPQPLTVVQLTELNPAKEGRQIIQSTITDQHGRFIFTVKPDRYQLMASKQGFEPTEMKIHGDETNLVIKLATSSS